MDNSEFMLLYTQHVWVYVVLLIFNFMWMYFLLRKRIDSILDPLFYTCLLGAFANTVVPFLYLFRYVSLELLIVFYLSEIGYWLGFLLFKKNSEIKVLISKNIDNSNVFYTFFIFSIFYIVFVKIYGYSIVGIPLLNESRFINRQNQLVAILDRTTNFSQTYVIIYSYYLLNKCKLLRKRFIAISSLLLLVLFNILNGSKGFILSFVFCFFIYRQFYLRKTIKIKVIYLLPLLISPVVVIAIYYGVSDFQSAISFLLYRFVCNGDGYWQGFGYNIVNYIDNSAAWFERVFSFILGPLGLVSKNAKIPIGTLILNQINPGTIGTLEGANSRVPLFCIVCFNIYIAPLCAFCLGVVASKISYGIKLVYSSRLIGTIVQGVFYSCGMAMITDPTLCLSSLMDLLFGVIMFNLYCLCVGGMKSPIKR